MQLKFRIQLLLLKLQAIIFATEIASRNVTTKIVSYNFATKIASYKLSLKFLTTILVTKIINYTSCH